MQKRQGLKQNIVLAARLNLVMRINYAHNRYQKAREVFMHYQNFNTQAPKKAANVSINNDLLRKAKELKINLSQALEQRLVELLRDALGQEWQQQNKVAIQHYNRRIQKNGAFSDNLRRF